MSTADYLTPSRHQGDEQGLRRTSCQGATLANFQNSTGSGATGFSPRRLYSGLLSMVGTVAVKSHCQPYPQGQVFPGYVCDKL